MTAIRLLKPLNLTDDDRIGVTVTYSVNRFYVYARKGFLLFGTFDLDVLNAELEHNKIVDAKFDAIASRMATVRRLG